MPVLLIDTILALQKLEAGTVEGIFRIPADTTELAALRKRFEDGEVLSVRRPRTRPASCTNARNNM